jgi:hypothetical protein
MMVSRPILERLRRAWCLDLRSLALFRIGLALIILGDLAARVQGEDLAAFYTDAGLLSRQALTSRFGFPELWSFHLMAGTAAGVDRLFALAAFLAFLLLIGFRTRAATIASWVMLVSLQNRDPFILHGADALLRLLLFWAIFLPLGARFSVDAWSLQDDSGTEDELPLAPFWPSLALAAQIAIVYAFTVLLKSGPEWHHGSAVSYALSLEQLATPFGQWLRDVPHLLRLATYAVLAVEWAIPLLIFVPGLRGRPRLAAVALILLLQAGLGLSLRVGHFPFVAGVAALALLPPSSWDRDRSPGSLRVTAFPRVLSALTALLLLYVLLWNLATVGRLHLPDRVQSLARILRLDQEWDMFSPSPVVPDGWYVMLGTRSDGVRVDAWRRRPFSDSQWIYPGWRGLYAQYPSERWAVYLMDYQSEDRLAHRILFADYLCRRWDDGLPAGDPARLQHIEIYFMQRERLLDRSPSQPIRKRLIHQQDCPQ